MGLKKLELSVGELALRAGIAPSAVRYYEDQGLIFARRTAGNQRRYHRAMLRRVAFIKASQVAGIPLGVIAEVLAELGHTESPSKAMWEAASRRWLDDLDTRIALLERLRDMIGSCVGCGCLSLGACHLLNPGDELNRLGPGPRRLLDEQDQADL
ncbi:redox-sensitive transcriptional activator SoxR [Gordonia sp. NPDC003376]